MPERPATPPAPVPEIIVIPDAEPVDAARLDAAVAELLLDQTSHWDNGKAVRP